MPTEDVIKPVRHQALVNKEARTPFFRVFTPAYSSPFLPFPNAAEQADSKDNKEGHEFR